MKPERYKQVKEIFAAAVECDTGSRAALLGRVCNGDEELRLEVESLLEHDKPAVKFIEESVFEVTARRLAANDSQAMAEQRIGAYKILREIGRGGMGVVYFAARDDDQFHKHVAIKLIKRGMDTDAVLQRFRNERQILAGLEHPNITRLLDGGTTADGVPYFVMEYVEGETINRYCDSHKLSTDERLKLFRQICAAVHYAHQNLVIHRDIKPINILVTADGTPKLLDFGIASVLSPNVQQETLLTAAGLRVLTPEYASPEQIRGEKITTASDVFSLGVLLYELLTGHRPHRFESLRPDEVARLICEEAPEKPSHAISRVEELHGADGELHVTLTPETVSATRDGQPEKLRRRLSGDLDNILLMAMRKEPQRRYSSAAQLSEDIRRHLAGLPVIARKNTFSYQGARFVKRHRVGVLATVLILLSLIGGVIATVRQGQAAQREREKAEAINSFLQTMLNASNPNDSPGAGHDLTVKDVLNEASARLATEDLSGQPEVKAELQRIIGTSYLSQGQYDLAEQNLRSALEAQTKIYGEDSLESLKTQVLIAQLWLDRGENAEAENFFERTLPILRAAQKEGTLNADYLITALYDFALLRRARGDSKQAEMLLRETLNLRSQSPSDAKNKTDVTDGVLALTLADQGKFDEAEKIVREKIASLRAQTKDETPELCTNLTGLGSFLMEQGKNAEAEENLVEAEGIYRKLYNPSYLPLGDNLRLQAQALCSEHRYAEAETKINETLKIYRATTSQQYINYATALMIQGLIGSQTGKTEEAEKLLREAARIRSENLPETHFLRATANGALGEFLTAQRNFTEAEPLLLNSYDSLKISQGANSPRTRVALQRLVALYQNWGRPDAAREYQSKL
jgi:serine/threonine-protein kinase